MPIFGKVMSKLALSTHAAASLPLKEKASTPQKASTLHPPLTHPTEQVEEWLPHYSSDDESESEVTEDNMTQQEKSLYYASSAYMDFNTKQSEFDSTSKKNLQEPSEMKTIGSEWQRLVGPSVWAVERTFKNAIKSGCSCTELVDACVTQVGDAKQEDIETLVNEVYSKI